MHLIDRYLISSWLKYFLIILGFFGSMLMVKEAYNHFLDLIKENFSIYKIINNGVCFGFSKLVRLICRRQQQQQQQNILNKT